MPTITVVTGAKIGPVYTATSTVNWTGLGSSPYASWENWTIWNPSPSTASIKVFEDAGAIAARAPVLYFKAFGDVTVSLKISDTVDSNLNLISPTTINFVGSTAYSFPSGRYYEYTITVTQDSANPIPYFTEPQIIFETGTSSEVRRNVNTSTLSGTIDARQIDTELVVTTLIATAQQEGVTYSSGLLQDRVYAVPDDYVFQENAVIVNIVSKSPATIRCFDLNGESIDAVVDLYLEGIPKIYYTTTDGVITI